MLWLVAVVAVVLVTGLVVLGVREYQKTHRRLNREEPDGPGAVDPDRGVDDGA